MALPDKLTAEALLGAYAAGYFPMAESHESTELFWFNPPVRGVLTLKPNAFRVPQRLRQFMRHMPYTLSYNTAFSHVMRACAHSRLQAGKETWINDHLIALYCELHERGHGFSVEVWEKNSEKDHLIGGLYGIAMGGAFFGESMFSLRPNASKVALVRLVESLTDYGFELLDAQFENDHLIQFGFAPMEKDAYLERLHHALKLSPNPSKRLLSDSLNKS